MSNVPIMTIFHGRQHKWKVTSIEDELYGRWRWYILVSNMAIFKCVMWLYWQFYMKDNLTENNWHIWHSKLSWNWAIYLWRPSIMFLSTNSDHPSDSEIGYLNIISLGLKGHDMPWFLNSQFITHGQMSFFNFAYHSHSILK